MLTSGIKNVVVYLVGFPGTGKLTIGRELAPLLDAKVVDNHWINNPIFGLLESDGTTKYPDVVWDRVGEVRRAVHDTIATLSPAHWNFVFTHAGHEDDPADHVICAAVLNVAKRRNALFVPVRLICAEDELVRRVAMPERRERLKSICKDSARRRSRTRQVLTPNHPNLLNLDVTALSALEAAARIMDHIQAAQTTLPTHPELLC
jgi:AAA domain